MKIIGWIREGDKSACGGKVVEGLKTCTGRGVPYSYQGARMACHKNCVIAEGFARSTLSNGRSRVIHGMITSGGCPLYSTLNDIDGVGNEDSQSISSEFYQTADGEWLPKFGPEHFTGENPDEQVRAIDAKTGKTIPELAYYIEAPDGTTYTGYTDTDGLCERVATYQPEELTVWFGEDAEKKKQVD